MAGSLTARRRESGDEVETIEVECRRLQEYLRQPVHFLKIDIEGAEDKVLADCADSLHNVQHLFCEYHHGSGLATNRLAKILALLDDVGFAVHVSKSTDNYRHTHRRAMSFVKGPYSAVLWAKNKKWGH